MVFLAFRANCAEDRFFAKLLFDRIDRLVEPDIFLRVFVEPDLVIARDQTGKADAQQPNQHPAVIEFAKDLLGRQEQQMIGIGIIDRLLPDDGIKVGIAKFYRHSAGKLILLTQSKANGLGHPDQLCMEEVQAYGIGLKGLFCRD